MTSPNSIPVPNHPTQTISKPTTATKEKLLLVLSTAIILVLIFTSGFLFSQNSKLTQRTQQLNHQINATPTSKPIKTNDDSQQVQYQSIQIPDVEGFLDRNTFKDRATKYLIDNSYVTTQQIINLNCSKPFTSGYASFESKQTYLDDSFESSIAAATTNADKEELKDNQLLNFIKVKNQQLQQDDPRQRIRDIAKCVTPDNTTIVAYTLFLDLEKTHGIAMWMGYLQDNNTLSHTKTILEQNGLFGCDLTPFVFTSDQVAYFKCGMGDAGHGEVSIYRISFANEELIKCTSSQILGIDPDPPEIGCQVPIN